MPFPLCRHIRTTGLQCQAIALSNGPHCYFHDRLYRRHVGFHHTPETRGYVIPSQHIELAPLEDRESIQVALSVVINALATGQLETRRATALLYGLQTASNNAGRLRALPYPPDLVRTVNSTPEGLDLAIPGATFPDDDEDDLLNEHESPDAPSQTVSSSEMGT